MKRQTMMACAAGLLAVTAVLTLPDSAGAHTRITTDVTWSEHIRPIFIEKCMRCHHPGGIAPDFADFTVYGTDTKPRARAMAVAIEEMVLTGQMPPWRADPRFGVFSNARRLTQKEIDLIVAWVEGGAPQGPYRNLPVPEQFLRTDWEYGRPDLVFSFPQGHVVPAEQQYDVAEIALPVEIEEDTYITGYEFLVDNPKNVFRMTAYVHDPEGVEVPPIEVEVQKAYDPLAAKNDLKEVRQREMPKGPHFIGQWVRGERAVLFPPDAGRVLRKGSRITLRIEYARPAFAEDYYEEIRDNSMLGLFVAQPEELIDLLVESKVVENPEFVIKAGAPNQEVRAELPLEESVHLLGIHPVLGPLAKNLRVQARYPDGMTRVLLWIPEHKREWTGSYLFAEPVPAPAGTTIELAAHYDNTADNWDNPNDPPADVAAGPGVNQARLFAMLDYMLDDHLNVQAPFVPKKRTEAESVGGMLFNDASLPDALSPKGAFPKEPGATAEAPAEESPIKVSKNGYHQVEAMMKKPGEVQVYVYDDKMVPLDPRNFAGEIELDGDASSTPLPLVMRHPADDHLTAWVKPELPVSFEARLNLAGVEEAFRFELDELAGTEAEPPKYPPVYNAPKGGWIQDIDDGFMRIEATLEAPGKLRVYFYTHDLAPVDPRNFAGGVSVIDAQSGQALGVRTPLEYPEERADHLVAKIPEALPVSVDVHLAIGQGDKAFRFDFDELTEPPWDDWSGEETAARPLIVGPHGSPEFYLASSGIHFVEGTAPRPGEFRLYFYDEWKRPVSPRLFSGTILCKGQKIPLQRYEPSDGFLSAFVAPELPLELEAEVWMRGTPETFAFRFDAPTPDPALAVDTAGGHMDHTPVHGGQFFMADDMFHHVEGAMPRPGEFRMYFYDNFKKAIDPRNFSGAVYIEHTDEETGEVREDKLDLFYARSGDGYLSAELPTEMPVTLYTIVSIAGKDKRYDFEFDKLTIDAPKAVTAAAPAAGGSAASHSHARPPLTVPDTIGEIVAAILDRDEALRARVRVGDWSTMYIPAFDARDLLAALAGREAGFSVRQQGQLKTLVGSINRSVNKIEIAAHTADPPRIQRAYDEFSKGVEQLRGLYAQFLK